MHFTKMHGLGNDYVYVDAFTETVPDPAALAVRVADRHLGVGGDGLILVLPPDADAPHAAAGGPPAARMRMFNADGSEAEMCGNGIRCVCKLVHDHRLGDHPDANPMRIQTGNGTLSLGYTLDAAGNVDSVTVDMGTPILDPARVPLDVAHLRPIATDGRQADPPVTFRLDAAGRTWDLTAVSMGNPHAVLFLDAVPDDWPAVGRAIEAHPAFPQRVNVHFVRPHSRTEVEVLHWERGSGATLACGTGACAVAVAGALTGRTGRRVTTRLPGGPLVIEWRDADNHVHMTGPAVEVFTGTWPG